MANTEIKAAFRIFYREKSYSLINLAGLTLAVVCCLILGLYLRSELTYEQHNEKYRQIYRVVHAFTHSGPPDRMALTQIPLGTMLKENYADVQDYVRFVRTNYEVLIRCNDKISYWKRVYGTDKNVFDIFTHKVLYGDPKTALNDPDSVAVSETFAKFYFGNINPIGQIIKPEAEGIIDSTPRKITLVFQDLPENTHMKYDVLFRWVDPPNIREILYNVASFTYLLMPENYNIKSFKTISNSFYQRFFKDNPRMAKSTWECWLQPLKDIHLHSDLMYDLPTGNIYYIYGFTAVALFILLVACINYVNLAIARATKRAKEIGMRKILGVSKPRLMTYFFGEAAIFTITALITGIILTEALLKLTSVNNLFDMRLPSGLTGEPYIILALLVLGLVITLFSGFYPAVYLSSVAPISALTDTKGSKSGGSHVRELLVFIQVMVSITVITCTLIMVQQMLFVSDKPMGFDKKERVIINLHGLDVIEKYKNIKTELLKDSHILGVSAISEMICSDRLIPADQGMVDNAEGVPEATSFSYFETEEDLLKVMGMQLINGRDFNKKLLTDVGTSFIVNETLVKARGWKEPLGKRIQLGGLNGKVIGVVKDFHYKPIHTPIEPLAIWKFNDEENYQGIPPELRDTVQRFMIVHINNSAVPQTLEFLREQFQEFDPRHPFEFEFLDDSIQKNYMSEERLVKMAGIFCGICIFISCLGLYGLSSFSTEQRSREIGIRKVLGASTFQIIFMLARKTIWLVLGGALIATVIAYFAIDKWLMSFAYRIDINPLVFLLSILIVLGLAFLTIAVQSFKTAQRNPSLTLHYE
jgi:putative ABC transport system permease protein